MRFLSLVKSAENSGPPPRALMEAIAAGGAEPAREGVLIDRGGLAPSAQGARVRLSEGRLTVIDGPFTEAKEVIGGYAMLELPSKAAAVESATWLLELHKTHWPEWSGEVEIRQVMTPDVGPAQP